MTGFDPIFRWIEEGALSTYLRESSYGFILIVVLHTLGMGVLAGGGALIDLRLLGLARPIPLAPLQRFLPLLWAAFGVNLVSGLLLLAAYPTKALTNPVFYLKLTLLGAAMWVLAVLAGEALGPAAPDTASPRARRLAALSLLLWAATILAGRLLAYTHTRVLVDMRSHY